MLFNSISFFIFLPIVCLLYWWVPSRYVRWQNLFVVGASYFFYGCWSYRMLALIAFTSLCSWLSGIVIEQIHERRLPVCLGKAIVGVNVSLNLLILGYFKYYNFFVDSLMALFAQWGFSLHLSTVSVLLPVGISFYTFQAIGYSIDVYKTRVKATRDPIAFFAFVSFFPQLVAGPIERADHLLTQFCQPRRWDYAQAVAGVHQMLWGFFKKLLIADNCAPVVEDIFSNYAHYPASTLWMGALLFTFQIYGDFSGYSDIAIGTAKLFGIQLRDNFRYPYCSEDIMAFWRRWHISLNTWFIDYVYIPLGGSRCAWGRHLRNLFIVFLLSGLWHGANWTFVAWGFYHALLYVCLLSYRKWSNRVLIRPSWLSSGFTFVWVLLGWILFRSSDVTSAWAYITHLFTTSWVALPKVSGVNNVYALLALFFAGILFLVEGWNRQRRFGLEGLVACQWYVRYGCYVLLLFGFYFFSNNASGFIYFQF